MQSITAKDFRCCVNLLCLLHTESIYFICLFLGFGSLLGFMLFLTQVQIQGEQGQTVGQVLQVASPTHQQLSGVTTTQLVQQGELTEEQQQQVRPHEHTDPLQAGGIVWIKAIFHYINMMHSLREQTPSGLGGKNME